jgi:hypothetical protein
VIGEGLPHGSGSSDGSPCGEGAYTHPDGDIELDIDEKAGVDPRDSEAVKEAKLDAYIKQEGIKELKGRWFYFGLGAAVLIYNYQSIRDWLLKFLG